MEITTKNAKETREFGEKIGFELIELGSDKKRFGGNIFGLVGDLGSGKTTFVQGLASGLGIKQRIISPTFIIVRNYLIPNNDRGIKEFYHIDLYRLEDNIEKEITNLGLKEIWSGSGNIIAVEWAEKIKSIISKSTCWIEFEDVGEDERRIVVKYV